MNGNIPRWGMVVAFLLFWLAGWNLKADINCIQAMKPMRDNDVFRLQILGYIGMLVSVAITIAAIVLLYKRTWTLKMVKTMLIVATIFHVIKTMALAPLKMDFDRYESYGLASLMSIMAWMVIYFVIFFSNKEKYYDHSQ
jgi:uncharacterized BrkB/YihY/UPF0761 family membrane protein